MEENPYSVSGSSQKKREQIVERPVTATIIGIVSMIFGCMGLFGASVALVYSLLLGGLAPSGPGVPEVFSSRSMANLNLAGMATSIPLSTLLIVSAVGLMRFKMWGRKLAIWWASLNCLSVIASSTFMVLLVARPVIEAFESMGPGDPQFAGLVGGTVGGVVGTCSGLIYPIVVLIFMNRRNFIKSLQYTEERNRMNRPGSMEG